MAAIGQRVRAKENASQRTEKTTSHHEPAKSAVALSKSKQPDVCQRVPKALATVPVRQRLPQQGIRLRQNQPSRIAEEMTQFEAQAYYQHSIGSPRIDQLLTLVQFNVIRAYFSNASALGFGLDWLLPDAESPFSAQGVVARPEISARDLRPSILQQTVLHHPWIDMLPVPNIRDNLLRAEGTYDEDDLCNDLVDFDGICHEMTGLIIWGQPWETSGWEVSETFQRKWPWVLKGCEDLYAATNRWRALRGEEPLQFLGGNS